MGEAMERLVALSVPVRVDGYTRKDPVTGKIVHVKPYVRKGGLHGVSWAEVQAKYPGYGEAFKDAWLELAYGAGGYPASDYPTRFTVETVQPRDVRFQRYDPSDSRVRSAMEAVQQGKPLPPVLLVERAGELLTADGHHRLTVAEILHQPVTALIAHSTRKDPYTGRARVGTKHKPRKP